MIPKIEVRETGKREFGLYVNDQLIGTSKLQCDAEMQQYFLLELFAEVARESYIEGQTTEQEFGG